MSDFTPRIHDVRYNAAEQCFEALVTLHTPQGRVHVASHFAAPMDAEFETIARGLLNGALSGLASASTLKSRRLRAPIVPPRRAMDAEYARAA